MNYLERITIDPEICHGKPCIRGMRWPVVVILGLLEGGMSVAEILEDHPELEKEDIYPACNMQGYHFPALHLKSCLHEVPMRCSYLL